MLSIGMQCQCVDIVYLVIFAAPRASRLLHTSRGVGALHARRRRYDFASIVSLLDMLLRRNSTVMVFADCTRALNIRWPDALQAGEPLVQMAGDKMASGTIMCRTAK
jgi:hypothetical protein